jgi:hypothetical protein
MTRGADVNIKDEVPQCVVRGGAGGGGGEGGKRLD